MTKQLYDYWFVQFDFPDENGRPYKSSGGETVWNKKLKRDIPISWETKQIDDATKFIMGNSLNYLMYYIDGEGLTFGLVQ